MRINNVKLSGSFFAARLDLSLENGNLSFDMTGQSLMELLADILAYSPKLLTMDRNTAEKFKELLEVINKDTH